MHLMVRKAINGSVRKKLLENQTKITNFFQEIFLICSKKFCLNCSFEEMPHSLDCSVLL